MTYYVVEAEVCDYDGNRNYVVDVNFFSDISSQMTDEDQSAKVE